MQSSKGDLGSGAHSPSDFPPAGSLRLIALVADHAGFELKNIVKRALHEHDFAPLDLGSDTADPVDYPDMAGRLATALRDGRAQRGMVVCGSGIGIRGQPLFLDPGRDVYRRHDRASRARAQRCQRAGARSSPDRGLGVARDCLLTFLNTGFAGGRHAARVAKLSVPAS